MDVTLTTAAVDREGDVVAAGGWQLANYLQNPVVLYGHDYKSLPVGKAVSLTVTETGLSGRVRFPEPGTYAFADTVRALVKQGFLNAVSVGFKPIRSEPNAARGGTDFHEQELLEFSFVPVPANPEALVSLRSTEGGRALCKIWASQIREMVDPEEWKKLFGEQPKGSAKETNDVSANAKDAHEARQDEVAITKTGRVLSKANETRLRDALGDITTAVSRVNEVLEQLGIAPSAEESTQDKADHAEADCPDPKDCPMHKPKLEARIQEIAKADPQTFPCPKGAACPKTAETDVCPLAASGCPVTNAPPKDTEPAATKAFEDDVIELDLGEFETKDEDGGGDLTADDVRAAFTDARGDVNTSIRSAVAAARQGWTGRRA
jgi:HK97 family phage prohead protease